MSVYKVVIVVFCFVMICVSLPIYAESAKLNLSDATLVVSMDQPRHLKAAQMLQEEIWKRADVMLPIRKPGTHVKTAFILTTADCDALPAWKLPDGLAVPTAAEGFAIGTMPGPNPKVYLLGRDERGLFFAVGKLLRQLELRSGKIQLPADYAIATAPKYPIRGHQVGYRNTANSYDNWDLAQYEQYARDLLFFGANAMELIDEPAKGWKTAAEYVGLRDYVDGPLLRESQWDMNVKVSKMLDAYDMEIWLWEPLGGYVEHPEARAEELRWRKEFYSEMTRVDHVMVPGGDPGHTHPDILMPFLGEMAEVLHECFPEAGLWVSNQKFTPNENDAFYKYLNEEQPDWLEGVAFGPGTLLGLKVHRDRSPAKYRLRRYPDITHNVRCQYGVPDWDGRHAQTLGREGINPRPTQMQVTHNVLAPLSDGFVSYSDGVHDDLNKAVWSALAWDPEADLNEILEEYGRVFFGSDLAEDVARGLLMLENNMRGHLIDNDGVNAALAQWKKIGEEGGDAVAGNWRYQMYYFRALYDAYIRERLIAEMALEEEASAVLSKAADIGTTPAIDEAKTILAKADRLRLHMDWRIELEEMGLALLRSIGFQFSIREPYRARNPERGALLDKLERPMNDRLWLEDQFGQILSMTEETERLARIDRIVHWEDPGPGGFYDDLGNSEKQPHLVYQTTYAEDPGFVYGPQGGHYRSLENGSLTIAPLKFSWLDQGQTLYGQPLVIRYEDLDVTAEYRIRATYFGRYGAVMRLMADGKHEIHGPHPSERPPRPVEFDIPKAATQDGALELSWELINGRGCQVAELWLIKK